MTWPEAFTTVGIAMAVALVVYSICRCVSASDIRR
ncbi:bacteriophage protein [Shigella sonnei]|nr:bacteriophage protein [Shigella sonnei]